MKCDTCGAEMRVKVELFLDIPFSKWCRLSKKSLRESDVRVDGANWPKASLYCPNGHKFIREVPQ
jgi:hypothetical protein